jgi:hypothetical protein
MLAQPAVPLSSAAHVPATMADTHAARVACNKLTASLLKVSLSAHTTNKMFKTWVQEIESRAEAQLGYRWYKTQEAIATVARTCKDAQMHRCTDAQMQNNLCCQAQ